MSDESLNYNLESMESAPKHANSDDIESMSFREAMAALNKTVAQLEGNTLELEESLKQYEYGVKLLASLQKRLNGAQQQIEELMGKVDKSAMTDEQSDSTLS